MAVGAKVGEGVGVWVGGYSKITNVAVEVGATVGPAVGKARETFSGWTGAVGGLSGADKAGAPPQPTRVNNASKKNKWSERSRREFMIRCIRNSQAKDNILSQFQFQLDLPTPDQITVFEWH